MKFTLETSGRGSAVTARAAGEVRIGGEAFVCSVVVAAGSSPEPWPVSDIGSLSAEALETVLALDPEIVILGTGEQQVFPAPELFALVSGRGVGFEVMDNGAACRTYNVLLAEGRNVALALIL